MISVIVPVFNGEKYIEHCVRSALDQSYNDVEIVIVDDGSKDSSGAICDSLASSYDRIKVIHQSNGGVSAARKAGIDNASGEWVCFLDVDDSLPEGALEQYSHHLGAKPDIIASGETPDLSLNGYKSGLMRRKSHPELWGKLFRTEFIRENYPILDRSIIVGEDQIINLVLANRAGEFITMPDLQYRYNLSNPESVMKRFRRTAEYEIKFENIFDSIVRPEFDTDDTSLTYAEYKMKIEGFKMVVLDGNRFDPDCRQWQSIVSYYRQHPDQPASSERLIIKLQRAQWMYEAIMKLRLSL